MPRPQLRLMALPFGSARLAVAAAVLFVHAGCAGGCGAAEADDAESAQATAAATDHVASEDPDGEARESEDRAGNRAETAAKAETSEDEGGDAADDEPEVFVAHTVQQGHTLWEIAKSYGVSVDAIAEASGLGSGDARSLRAGTTLRIPGVSERKQVLTTSERREKERESLPEPEDGAYHFMSKGETLWALARMYGVTSDEIIARNEFSDSEIRGLRPGDPVLIPGIDEEDVKKAKPKSSSEEGTTTSGIRHTLAPGETIWDLAHAFRVSVSEIMTANGLSTAEVKALRDGTELYIPGVQRDDEGNIVRRKTARQKRALRRAERLGLGTTRTAGKLMHGRVEDEWIDAIGRKAKRLPGTLRWPVTNGWYVRGFGSGAGGYHQAVDIAGEIGWNVRAAARGIVGYSGDGVSGYGNMVLVVHPGGWVTMYAHNSVNFVVAGERVPRGGILAELGSTGLSRGPHVHFALMHRHRNCDPASLFRPGIKHRDGDMASVERLVWRNPRNRPGVIECERRRRHPRSQQVANETPRSRSGD